MSQLNENLRLIALGEAATYNLAHINLNIIDVKESIISETIEDFDELNTEKTLLARHQLIGAENSSPSDYVERIRVLDDGCVIQYGIRHKGCNPNLAFINLMSSVVLSRKRVAEFYELICSEFDIFNPKEICFHTPTKADCDSIGNAYMFINRDDFMALDSRDGLELEQVKDERYYPWYENEYKRFHKDRNDLSLKVTINSESLMNSSLKEGNLFFAYKDGERVGIIAGEHTDFFGTKALYFNEILISRDHIGKGLARSLQYAFIKKRLLDCELIFGTIDYANKPSLKTALSNGRKCIRFENFINI